MPKILAELPILQKLLIDREEPNDVKSKTDIADPILMMP